MFLNSINFLNIKKMKVVDFKKVIKFFVSCFMVVALMTVFSACEEEPDDDDHYLSIVQ